MKSLLRMSEDELALEEAGHGFQPGTALGVAAGSTVLSMAAMMLQFSPGDDVPIAGMDTLSGQLTIATGLGTGMLAAAWLIRGVMMKRLQWAVLISLLIHVCLCVALKITTVHVPVALAADVGDIHHPDHSLALPDYGGMEAPSQQQQEWDRVREAELTESQRHQIDRQQSDIEFDAQLDPVEAQQQRIAAANAPERRQQQMDVEVPDQQADLQKQQRQAEADAMQQLEVPQVQTSSVQQTDVQARQLDRSETSRSNAQRQAEELQSHNEMQVRASEIAARETAQARNELDVNPELSERQMAEAAVADAAAQSVEAARAADAARMSAEARQLQAARQQQAELNSDRRAQDSNARSEQSLQVQRRDVARSQSSASNNANLAFTDQVSAAMQRQASANSASAAAGNASAEAVNVSAAASAANRELNASASASQVNRSRTDLPAGTAGQGGGGGAPAIQSSPFGASTLQAGTIGRASGRQPGMELGDVAANFSDGAGGRSQASAASASAAGSRAEQVAVSGAASGTDLGRQLMAGGPSAAASGADRSATGLPSSTGRGSSAVGPSATDGNGQNMNLSMRTGDLSGGGSTNGFRAGSRLPGGSVADGLTSGTGRRSADVTLSGEALRAEAAGALVMVGPQAERGGDSGSGQRSSSGSILDGPRMSSVTRRSSGLPGSGRSGLPGGSGTAGSSLTSVSGPRGLSGRRPSSAAATPVIAGEGEVAAMIRRSVPGISSVATERISEAFSMRTPEARREAVQKLGGSDASEAAVDRGLEYLAAHQYAAGNWSMHDPNCKDHRCSDYATYESDPAATGLALLAFLGAGHTHRSGDYQQEVGRGLNWLIQNQASDGDLFNADHEFARFYSHGMAAIALCEAYGMTRDERLKQPAQKAIDFIMASQHAEFGGWRYQAQFESDTSVSGWQMMALKSGEMSGLQVKKTSYAGVTQWLNAVEDADAPGRFRYHPTKPVTDSMTAEGLLMREYLGAGRNDAHLQAGAAYLRSRLPRPDDRDVYYWYYGTQVMFHMQGPDWTEWNAALRDMLVDDQEKAGAVRGSWSPQVPTKDKWGNSGGRHYVTCLNLLMLEVYYRHLPLYIELQE
ncbi:MAG: hypothetical protein R3C49_18510 [Planctomycetaceae bacterium]